MRIKYLILILLIFPTLSACGTKGPVRPLETPLPGPATALELRQQGASLLLGWQLPTKNLDGSALNRPPVLDIYRMTFDPADDCPECYDRSTLLHRIDPEFPEPSLQVGERYLLNDRQVKVGTGYQYKLVPRYASGEIGRPVILRQVFSEPVAAPGHFQAIPHDSSARLSWQAIPLDTDEKLLGYQLYRRLDGTGRAPYPLHPQPLQETSFEDFSLNNGTRYHYRVRALIKHGDQQVEGLASEEFSVIPKAGI